MKIGLFWSPPQPAVPGTVDHPEGLWSMTVWPGEYLKLAFEAPGKNDRRNWHLVMCLLGLGYLAVVMWALYPSGFTAATLLAGGVMLSLIPIVAFVWRTLPINAPFIPYSIEFDLRSGMARLTDLRDEGQQRVCSLSAIESFQEWPVHLPRNVPFRTLRLKLSSGEELFLPHHGAHPGPVLEPIRSFLNDGIRLPHPQQPQAR